MKARDLGVFDIVSDVIGDEAAELELQRVIDCGNCNLKTDSCDLITAFSWQTTTQGFYFWQEIYKQKIPSKYKEPDKERSKYRRKITDRKTGDSIMIDVYDVSEAFPTSCPALEHAKKKVLAAGLRGHKDYLEDLYDIQSSIKSAIELELMRQDETNN